MVCHDGSPASQEALKTTKDGYMSENSHLYVAHAYSLEKEEYLPYNLKKDYIKNDQEGANIGLGSRFNYIQEEALTKNGETPKSVLNRMAIDKNVDVTVVGYHGRKGPKDDPTIMGSAVQFMAQNSGSPILIVKDGLNR